MLGLSVNKIWAPSMALMIIFSCGKVEKDAREVEPNNQLSHLRLDSKSSQVFLPAQDNGCDNGEIDFAPTGSKSFGYIGSSSKKSFRFWAPIKNVKFEFKTCWSAEFSAQNDRPRLRVFDGYDSTENPWYDSFGPNISLNAVGSHGLDQGGISNRANVMVELSTKFPDMIVDNLSAELFETPPVTLKITTPGQVKFEKGIGSSLSVETKDGLVTPPAKIKSFLGVWQGSLCEATQTNKCVKIIVDISQERQDIKGKFTTHTTSADSPDSDSMISGAVTGVVKGNVLFGSLLISSDQCNSKQIGFKLSEASELRQAFVSLDEKISCAGADMFITAFNRR